MADKASAAATVENVSARFFSAKLPREVLSERSVVVETKEVSILLYFSNAYIMTSFNPRRPFSVIFPTCSASQSVLHVVVALLR